MAKPAKPSLQTGKPKPSGAGTLQQSQLSGDSGKTLKACDSDFSFRAGDLGIHELRVVAFKADEHLSRLFRVSLDLASENRDLDLDDLVGRPGVLRIAHSDPAKDRFINGIVCRVEFTGEGVHFARYEAELVPFIWMLGLRHKSRIFQDMSVPEIVTRIFEDAGIPSDMVRQALTRDYPKRTYCVQYRESELDFIQRLLEEEGIFYFFEHTERSHVIVLGDDASAHQPIRGEPKVIYREPTALVEAEEFVSHFRFGSRVRPGRVMLNDFNFEQPKMNMKAEREHEVDLSLEHYDHPGEYSEPDVGSQLARVRLEAFQTGRKTGRAVTCCRRLQPGFRFSLDDHPRQDFNREYLITHLTHTGTQPTTLEDEPRATVPEGPLYENIAETIPKDVPFRPERRTPRPVVEGTQTAIVVGPSGEEIYTDEHGRVKVHFHWDREGVFDEKASCWIRVSQAWAGGKYGALFLPRIGHEVIVDFLEGDPDQPIIVGRVYNGAEQPPYALPGEKTKSTIRTANSKGQDGANELRFEDKKGEEQVFLHAEKDLHVRAKNDRVVHIEKNSHETIGGEHREKVVKSRSRKVEKDEAVHVMGQRSLKVDQDVLEDYGMSQLKEVGMDLLAKAGMKVLIEAGLGLTIKGPGGHVTIDPSGITISGTMVTITGSVVKINSGPGGQAQAVSAGSPASPAAPEDADTETPGQDTSFTGQTRQQRKLTVEKLEEKSWIEIELKDENDQPMAGEPYVVTTAEGDEIEGTLDVNGKARVGGIDPGSCQITFPNCDGTEWRRA